jgi:uncharacterized zinc-type alcohol dehydrogenase-like protein
LRGYAAAELDLAIAALASGGSGLHGGVHRARKSMRRVRATLRMCASALGPGGRWIDRALQQCNRSLSHLRDAHALTQTLERLAEKAPDETLRSLLRRAQRAAAKRRAAIAREPDIVAALADARALLPILRAALEGLPWDAATSATLTDAIAATAARADRLQARVRAHDRDDDWHAWRRQLRRMSQQHRACVAAGLEDGFSNFDKSLAEQLGAMQDLSLLLERCARESPFDKANRAALERFAKPALSRQRGRILSVTASQEPRRHDPPAQGSRHGPIIASSPRQESGMTTKAYGARAADKPLEPMDIQRREPGPHDVQIEIQYCGVCHSDLHTVRSEWPGTLYPCVPGHEIVGHVTAVGKDVKNFKVGETVAVGCLVGSCKHCRACDEGLEQYCEKGFIGTYNGATQDPPGHTLGGYAQRIVVDDQFVLKVRHPEEQLAAVAPLLCAGITTYSPLRHWKAGPGKKVGVVGIGGLGHMGIKLSHAMGAHTVAFTTSDNKREDAKKLGADEVVVSRNPAEMDAHVGSFDFILNTVAAPHDLDAFVRLLKRDGTMCLVGAPSQPHPSPSIMQLIFGRKGIAGSLIGGLPETQEMLDFCAERGIVSDIEMIRIQDIEHAYERMLKSDVKYRFVIDNKSLAR